jgi:GNAT superfamily N-acetyltransferase
MTTIRELRTEDREAWEPLWRGYLDFYRATVGDAVTQRTFERVSGGDADFHGLVALDAHGTIVGFAHAVFHPATWSAGPYCYLEDLYVERAGRGTGAGRALIEAVYAEADRRGAGRVYWHTQEYNGAARSLYDTVAHRTSFVMYVR